MNMKAAEIETKNMITNQENTGLCGDIDVVGKTTSSVDSVFQRLEKADLERVESDKTKCMLTSQDWRL